MAHQAVAYSSFCSIKRLEIFLLPPGWDVSPSQSYPQGWYPRLLLDGKRHCENKVSSKNRNQYSRPELEPRPLELRPLQSRWLLMWRPYLCKTELTYFQYMHWNKDVTLNKQYLYSSQAKDYNHGQTFWDKFALKALLRISQKRIQLFLPNLSLPHPHTPHTMLKA